MENVVAVRDVQSLLDRRTTIIYLFIYSFVSFSDTRNKAGVFCNVWRRS